jgi:hypothetical protein
VITSTVSHALAFPLFLASAFLLLGKIPDSPSAEDAFNNGGGEEDAFSGAFAAAPRLLYTCCAVALGIAALTSLVAFGLSVVASCAQRKIDKHMRMRAVAAEPVYPVTAAVPSTVPYRMQMQMQIHAQMQAQMQVQQGVRYTARPPPGVFIPTTVTGLTARDCIEDDDPRAPYGAGAATGTSTENGPSQAMQLQRPHSAPFVLLVSPDGSMQMGMQHLSHDPQADSTKHEPAPPV